MTPEIVLGPPGTGKTTALLEIVQAELRAGTRPERIGYLAFTRRAAGEAASRASEQLGLDSSELRYFRTIHSLCFRELGLERGDVLEGRRLLEFGQWCGVKLTEGGVGLEDGTTFGYLPGDRVLFLENLARVRGRTVAQQYDEDPDDLPRSLVERVVRDLHRYKADTALLDYTDMLVEFVARGVAPQLDVVLVDEAQDLSLLQWRVVDKLAAGARRVVIAGDDDQAIYRWAGADVERFVAMPGTVRVLGQSWRCPAAVQGLAAEVLARLRHRRAKEWAPRPEAGAVIRAERADAVDWSGDDVLVLVRNAEVARRRVLPLLSERGIVYEWRGASSVSRSTLDAVVIWEKLRRGEQVVAADVRRAYTLLEVGRGVQRGHKSLPRVPDEQPLGISELQTQHGLLTQAIWHEALTISGGTGKIDEEERTYLMRALRAGEKLTARPRVRVSTIHGAKGGQAERVVLLRDVARRTASEARRWPDDEARVWYVGVTRARQELVVVAPDGRDAYRL